MRFVRFGSYRALTSHTGALPQQQQMQGSHFLLWFMGRLYHIANREKAGAGIQTLAPVALILGVEIGQLFAQMVELREVVVHDVRIVGIVDCVILVICLCRVECAERS